MRQFCMAMVSCSLQNLGCIIDEHLIMSEMVEDRANAGSRALACFHRCPEEIGDLSVGIYNHEADGFINWLNQILHYCMMLKWGGGGGGGQ